MGCTGSNSKQKNSICSCLEQQKSKKTASEDNQLCKQISSINDQEEQDCQNENCEKKEQEKKEKKNNQSSQNCNSNSPCTNVQADQKQSESINLKPNQEQQQQNDKNLNIGQKSQSQTISNAQNDNNGAKQLEKENEAKDLKKQEAVDVKQIKIEGEFIQEKNIEQKIFQPQIGNQLQQNNQKLQQTPIQNQNNQQPNNLIQQQNFQSNSFKCVSCQEQAQIQLTCLHYCCSSCIQIQILKTSKGKEENLQYIKCEKCQRQISQSNIEDALGGKIRLKEILEQQKQQIQDETKSRIECKYCNQEIKKNQGVVLRNCNHLFCEKCVKSYIEQKINNGEVDSTKLICPLSSCRLLIDPDQVVVLFNSN